MRYLIRCVFLLIFFSFAWASEQPTEFNVKQATQKLSGFEKNLSFSHSTPAAYLDAIDAINELINQALICTENTQKELNNIEVFIKQSKKFAEATGGADLVYLERQKKKWANIQAECRLFTIRATEEVEDYKHAVMLLREKATLSRSTPIWTVLKTLQSPPSLTSPSTHLTQIIAEHSVVNVSYLWISAIAAFSFAFVFLVSLRKTHFSIRYLQFKRIKLRYIILLTLSVYFFALFTPFFFNYIAHDEHNPLLRPLGLCCLYFSSWFGLIFVFKIKSFRSLLEWYNLEYRFARACIFFIITSFTIAALGEWSADMQLYLPIIWQLLKTAYLYTLLFVCLAYVIYYSRARRSHHWVRQHVIGMRLSAMSLLSVPFILGTMGYLTLSLQLIYAGFVILSILFFMAALFLGSEKLYRYFYTYAPLKKRIMDTLGYKSDQTFTEFLILKIAIQLVVLVFGIFFIVKETGFSTETIEGAFDQFINGVHIANMTLYPTRIILGVVVFCLLYLTSRAISTKISAHQQFEDEEETQVAVASLLTYVGFSIAFVIGSLIAGFDFTGLAIIAGALSVGIGLGLQSIVNNFVSGLIILIEKPIKPGDRIAIAGIEGVVKKIRVRSTQIITSAREDIIIPNSDLITQRVVNFMLTDKYCRITFDIEVAYGSDTQLVRDTLLEIAHRHEEVIKNERNKPNVLLSNFGENGLIFQLTCLLKDVNKKSVVRSDINFEIDRIFREREISMPFVQREIHIHANDLKKLS